MAYKDKDKQREAQREWVRQKRADKQGSTEGSTSLKRGKNITMFEHLPVDVQQTIIRLTTNLDGSIDEIARANRTAIAINYQHLFPDRFRSTGLCLTKEKECFIRDRGHREGVASGVSKYL